MRKGVIKHKHHWHGPDFDAWDDSCCRCGKSRTELEREKKLKYCDRK